MQREKFRFEGGDSVTWTADEFRVAGQRLVDRLVEDFGSAPARFSRSTGTEAPGVPGEESGPSVADFDRGTTTSSLQSAFQNLLAQLEKVHETRLAHDNIAADEIHVVPEKEVAEQEWRSGIRQMMDRLQGSYSDIFNALVAFRHIVHNEAAHRIQSEMNAHLGSLDQESYKDKQALASWVNAQLRELGLAIKCPKTGRPANLVADLKDTNSDTSRFRLEIRGEDGKRARTMTVRTLPELEFIEDDARQEPLLQWTQRQKSQTSEGDKKKGRSR